MKILVRLPNWLGDVVMSSAAIDWLRRSQPEAEIHGLVREHLREVAALLPGIRSLQLLDRDRDRGLLGPWRFARQVLAPQRYDLYLSLPNSFSAALLGFLAGIPARRGYRGDLRALLLTESLALPQTRHRVEQYAALVAGEGTAVSDLAARLLPPGGVLPEPFAVRRANRRVVLNIQSEAASRRMSVEFGAELGRHLLARADVELVLTGTGKESARSAALAEALGGGERVRDWAGQTNLQVLAQLVADADLVISTDSGLSHLANGLGTPGVAVFGAGDPANTGPYNADICTVLQDGTLPCVPCVSNRCEKFPRPRCMETIDPAAVALAGLKRLDGQR